MKISVHNENPKHIHIKINSQKKHIRMSVRHAVVSYDKYSENEGDYSVVSIPFRDQTLETKDKVMVYDVTVRQIPYFSVSNPSDGLTVYIGQESELNA